MNEIERLAKLVVDFRDKRDWKQFHNPKDIAMDISIEAAEVLEHFQWKSREEIDQYIVKNKKEIGEELSDVLYGVLLMSHDLGIDLQDAFIKKMKVNEKKYPVKKAKGKNLKYTQL